MGSGDLKEKKQRHTVCRFWEIAFSEAERWAASAPQGCGGWAHAVVDLFCWLAVEQKPGSTPFAAASGIWDRTFICMYACGAPGTEACAHMVKRVHGASWWQRAPLLLWLWLWMDRLLRVPAVPCADQAPGPPCFDAVCCERVLWCARRRQARATMHWTVVRDWPPCGLEFVDSRTV